MGGFPKHIDISKIGNSTEEDIYTWNSDVPAIYHKNTRLKSGENKKLVDPTGRMEVIYNANGDIVIDSRDIGTYNFGPPNNFVSHLLLDMLTYYRWGNTSNDNANISTGLIGKGY